MATQIRETPAIEFRRFSADEYHRMGETGVLGEDERVELLDGFLIAMPPIGPRHEYAGMTLANRIKEALGADVVVRANGPIALSANSEPQPDVIVMRGPLTRYRDRHPGPADILLLVEVADSSRAIDRGPKARAYADAGIDDLWIVDLVAGEVLVLRDPGPGGFATTAVLRRGDRMSPLHFPGFSTEVSQFLEPVTS